MQVLEIVTGLASYPSFPPPTPPPPKSQSCTQGTQGSLCSITRACRNIMAMQLRVCALCQSVSCFIYRSEKAKPCNKWSTFVKIELKETLLDLPKRFATNDYGGFKNKAAEKGAGKPDFQLGVKHKKPDPPEFPNSRLFKP